MFKPILFSFLSLLLFVPLAKAQKADLISETVKSHIKDRVENGIYTGVVVGVIDSEGTHFYNYGVKSKASNQPVNKYSVFEIGSISKTFTGILLADMVEKGMLKLEDPLQKYLPSGVKAPMKNGAEIKLVEMSNHTSSLPRLPSNLNPANPANPYADYSEDQMYSFLNECELTRDIGSQYEYSNYAVGLLGYTLAKQNNMSYEELMTKMISKPLGMKSTGIEFTKKMKKNLAIGHDNGEEVQNWDLPTLAGAGAIRSTAEDMIKYIAANMGLVKNSLYPAMQLSHKNSRTEGSNPIVGLGWHTMKIGEMEIVWHNGGTGGYRSFTGFVKGSKKGVVVLSNSTGSVDDIGIHLLNSSSPIAEIKPSIAVTLKNIINEKGIDAGIQTYKKLKKENPDKYEFGESELNSLGYSYLGNKEVDKAIQLFKLNIEAFPNAANVYDSMGEAYMINGDNKRAIENYKKSVELNPANQGGFDKLRELGVEVKSLTEEVVVDDEILSSYVGKYELAPGFILSVTKDGNQLSTQATGQPSVKIYPKSENYFYLKVVEAQLTFNRNDEGKVVSVTLHQGGRNIPGKKLEE